MSYINVPIPNKGNYVVQSDGDVYAPNGKKLKNLTSYEAYHLGQYLRSHRNEKDFASVPMGYYFNKYYNIINSGEKNHSQRLKQKQKQQQNLSQIDEKDKPDNGTGSKPSNDGGDRNGVNPRGTRRNRVGTSTPPQTYNYNFGQYYTDNPNGDKSKPVAHDYFNADKYTNFRSAFNAAKTGGHGVFTWKGKAYNTMGKGDNADEFRKNYSDYDAFIGSAHRGIQDGIDNSGGWSGSPNYKSEQIVQTANPLPVNTSQQQTQQTPQRTRLQKFTDDDIRSLGFNNYQGLLNAANNPNNSNNRFLQSMYDRYGSNTSKWNQTTIENDLGVKGKYRRFGGGDFGDMSRSMMAWVGKNNGEIDKQDLQNRTGSNGTVYSSKKMRDLYEKYNPKKQQSTQTSATQTNTSTPSNTQNQQTTSQQSGTSGYKFSINQNNNTFSGDYSNPYSNFGYALSQYKKLQKGGTINMEEQQLQQAFLQYLMQETGAKDQQQLEQVIQQLGEEGLKQAYSKFLQEMQQQQVQAAKFGAKLNYIRHLNGQCPDGTEMTYFKVGGKLCKKCMQVKQNRKEQENESDNPIDAFKCGRKIRKNQNGRKFPLIETDKNGKNRTKYYKDEATRDSIAVNRYNDQDVQVNKPGSYKKNAKGKVQWTPDRTKAPYKKN